ncbi:MAG: phenylalanine--tRNA ligase subunit beta, partial [Desulfovibrio sp.]|nr:phenylalanine--tRNA ligase subunit beta [Desulfovibrio sp.]
GVMGGQNTEITPESRNIFLESAVFRPQTIRRTSRRLGLTSEASYRFERGVDQRRTVWALDRACALMARLGGGFVRQGFSVAEPKPFRPCRIPFRPSRADALLGVALQPAFCAEALESVGCAVEKDSPDVWTAIQPSWRPDLTREADLIEEVGRIYGLDAIEPELPPLHRRLDAAGAPESRFAFWGRIRQWGAGLGLNEAVNYSFVGHEDLDFLKLPAKGRISVMNPLSADQDVLRTALAPGLLRDLRNNLAQGAQGLRLFELANIFEADPASETTARETGMLGILLCGRRHETAWPHGEEDMDYADIKGMVTNLLGFLHLGAPECRQREGHPFLLPAVDILVNGEKIGAMGRVMPAIASEFHARKPVWLAELDLEILRRLHDAVAVSFRALPVYPPVRRDITVIARPGLAVGEVIEAVRGLGLPLLEDVALVDCFEPGGEDAGERHLTFRLTFRHADRTLNDAEVDKVRAKVAESLTRKLGVRI